MKAWDHVKNTNPFLRRALRLRKLAPLSLGFEGRIRPRINTINLMITDKCNGRCVFCNIGRSYNGEDLPSEDLLAGIRETFPHLRKISITGGEPMLYKGIAEVYHTLQPDYILNTVTNAQVLPQLRQFVDWNPTADMSTSLHGVGALHDQCMGIRGAFQNFLKAIDLIPGKTGAGMTICRLNYDKITEVYDFLTEQGLYFAVNIMDISELYYQNPNLRAMQPTPEQIPVILDQLNQVKTTQERWKQLQMQFLQGQRLDFDCYSGLLQVFVHNSGRIYPCIYMDKLIESLQLGDLKTRTVQQINMKPCRRCLTHCEAMSSLYVAMGPQMFLDRQRGKIRRRMEHG